MFGSIHHRNIKVAIFYSILVIIVVGIFFVFRAVLVKAEIATFYPDSCLGGWKNPHHAEGKPDVSNDNTNILDTNNSAILSANTISDIFCGNFKGDIPKDSYAKKIIVTFSWDVARDDSSQSPQNISGESFASSSGEILDAQPQTDFTLTASSSLPTSVPSPTESTSPSEGPAVVPIVPDAPVIPAAPTDTTDTAPASPAPTTDNPPQAMIPLGPLSSINSKHVSFLDLFIPKAFAAEDATATDTDISISASTSQFISIPADSSTTPTPPTSSSTSSSDTVTAHPQSGNQFLEVLYTIDGTHWKSLGTVDAEHVRYSVFEIPLPQNTKWSDMSNIQIDVKSLPSIDYTPSVYLDGMSLQVTYGKARDTTFVSKSGLYIPSAHSLSSDFDFQIRDNEKIEELVVTGESSLGNVVVFNSSTSAPVLTTFVDEREYVIQPEYFGEGNYVFITTHDPNSCSNGTLDGCRASGDYIGEGQFTVSTSLTE